MAADALSRDNLTHFLQVVPDAVQHPTPIPQGLVDLLVMDQPDWTLPHWTRLFGDCFRAGLAPSTERAYMAGKKKYLEFCARAGVPPIPVSEQGLVHFTIFAFQQGLKHQTIKSYLSAVHHLQVSCGEGDPNLGGMPQLALTLRGVKREQCGQPKRTRLPITPAILLSMRRIWEQDGSNWDHIMLWAACCLGFFGFLRSGELVAPAEGEFDQGQHLSFGDITVDNRANPSMLWVRIKQSKTDPFRQGVTIALGKTDAQLCPVAALMAYMALRGPGQGPLFRYKDGRPLTRQRLVEDIREALSKCGLNPKEYAGHSFRIGAATTAAACGVPADTIKTLGRWRSQAYQLYVRLPTSQLAGISRQLARGRSNIL